MELASSMEGRGLCAMPSASLWRPRVVGGSRPCYWGDAKHAVKGLQKQSKKTEVFHTRTADTERYHWGKHGIVNIRYVALSHPLVTKPQEIACTLMIITSNREEMSTVGEFAKEPYVSFGQFQVLIQ